MDAQLAGTCEQALRLAASSAYDAILLDLMMPGIGGLAVLKEIRAASPNAPHAGHRGLDHQRCRR